MLRSLDVKHIPAVGISLRRPCRRRETVVYACPRSGQLVPQLLVDFFADPLVGFYVLRFDASQAE